MNERTQSRLAWALSACLLTAGWLWRYLPSSASDETSSCGDATPRAVAYVVGSEKADPEESERVYVYWLGPSDSHGKPPPAPGLDAPGAANGAAPERGKPAAQSQWKLAGTTTLSDLLTEP